MFVIRSKTGANFRRSGVRFEHDRFMLVAEPTAEQLAEPYLLCVEVSEKEIAGGQYQGMAVMDNQPPFEPHVEPPVVPVIPPTKSELMAEAKALGLDVKPAMKVDTIAALIQEHKAAQPPVEPAEPEGAEPVV